MEKLLHMEMLERAFMKTLLASAVCFSLLAAPCFSPPFAAYAFWGSDLDYIELADKDCYIQGDVYDGAGLLSDDEISLLSDKLAQIEGDYQCDVAIITLKDSNGYDARDYAEAIYLNCGYGYGSARDGIMLAISMEDRDWNIITYGYGINAITDYGVEYISDYFIDDLSAGNYYDAFNTFADLSGQFLKEAREGTPYDVDHPARLSALEKVLPFIFAYGIAFIIALIICFIVLAAMKKTSKSTTAIAYMDKRSFRLTRKRDYYLYTTTVRKKREKSSDSSHGGSSVDDNGFGGGGGKF